MFASNTPQQPELLTSWKEIAAYLGKGVRTVQRWEQQFGLPVRRPNEKAKGIVHATRHELDKWLEMQWSQRPKEFAQAYQLENSHLEMMRAAIRRFEALRSRNRVLMEDMRISLSSIASQCEALAKTLNATSPKG
jgi:hypothetical protein